MRDNVRDLYGFRPRASVTRPSFRGPVKVMTGRIIRVTERVREVSRGRREIEGTMNDGEGELRFFCLLLLPNAVFLVLWYS